MKFNEKLQLKFNVLLEFFDKNGKRKHFIRVHNTVTSSGKEGVLDQILDTPTLAKPSHMELGSGTGGTLKLASYIAGSRTAFDSKTRSGNIVTMITTFPEGVGTGYLTEAGVFDSASEDSVNMWVYVNFTSQRKLATDTLVITWTLTQG